MKSYPAASAFLLAASLGVAACTGGQHAMGDPQPTQTSPGNPGAGPSDHVVSDSWITTKVKSELATTKGAESTDISVKTVNGVVTLTGVLANDIAVKKAVAAARSVDGVKQVDSAGLKSSD